MSTQEDLITWLRAQLDDDERDAPMRHRLTCDYAPSDGGQPCSCALPDLTLAEVDAKRRILDRLRGEDGFWRNDITSGTAEPVVRLLALPYADRPGYRETWRP
jgi:hypothetical protein